MYQKLTNSSYTGRYKGESVHHLCNNHIFDTEAGQAQTSENGGQTSMTGSKMSATRQQGQAKAKQA